MFGGIWPLIEIRFSPISEEESSDIHGGVGLFPEDQDR
ncbi:hypothetical protein LptCag_0746 [Leptospirillum ferriphilum]|uniref:Uncharacterized protein n=1 Tax=Leptospirillum ferriphilum TaxID=178606 RepID=A0A094WCC0_9BACT|nr:hypothetical protein LptCag_0746 [Leptospirillum ferriphilum]